MLDIAKHQEHEWLHQRAIVDAGLDWKVAPSTTNDAARSEGYLARARLSKEPPTTVDPDGSLARRLALFQSMKDIGTEIAVPKPVFFDVDYGAGDDKTIALKKISCPKCATLHWRGDAAIMCKWCGTVY